MARNYLQGRYVPKHPEKFEGDLNNIIYRSSWELRCLQFFDSNPSFTKVMSEEIKIPYWNPVKRKPANYYPDFYIELVDRLGKHSKQLIEVKPSTQIVEQKSESVYEKLTRAVNYAKWEAASKWCKDRGIEFRILSETEIFGPRRK